ncbi:MAG: hypothetical protein KIT27_07130 [Legionellales bacterium]|nr:hypothetical protein [Legionellales bacterium]
MKYLLWSCLFFISSACALHRSTLPETLQSHTTQPRYLLVTLPLLQTDAWIFTNRHTVLAGKLILTLQHEQSQQSITIFENGHFTQHWHDLPLGKKANPHTMNFKFISTQKYLTAPTDKLYLTLILNDAAFGQSEFFSGMVPAGIYHSQGIYSGLTATPNLQHTAIHALIQQLGKTPQQRQQLLHSLDHKAFLANWQPQWAIKMVNQHGWLSPPQIPFRN